MAKESVSILKGKIDVAKVLDELNVALSEEWLACLLYTSSGNILFFLMMRMKPYIFRKKRGKSLLIV